MVSLSNFEIKTSWTFLYHFHHRGSRKKGTYTQPTYGIVQNVLFELFENTEFQNFRYFELFENTEFQNFRYFELFENTEFQNFSNHGG